MDKITASDQISLKYADLSCMVQGIKLNIVENIFYLKLVCNAAHRDMVNLSSFIVGSASIRKYYILLEIHASDKTIQTKINTNIRMIVWIDYFEFSIIYISITDM